MATKKFVVKVGMDLPQGEGVPEKHWEPGDFVVAKDFADGVIDKLLARGAVEVANG